jgi:hypothetical protein
MCQILCWEYKNVQVITLSLRVSQSSASKNVRMERHRLKNVYSEVNGKLGKETTGKKHFKPPSLKAM